MYGLTMKVKYLSYKQASALCEASQHFVGHAYDRDTPGLYSVKAILIAPYSRILQWKFLQYLALGWTVADALAINVNGRYDVLVLPDPWCMRRDNSFPFKCLRDYLEEQGIVQDGFRPGLQRVVSVL